MAAGTPVIMNADAEAGVRLDAVLVFSKSAYSGAGTQRECRWQIDFDSGFTGTLLYDSGLRENDDQLQGDDWIEIPLPILRFLTGPTTYYVRCMVRNTSNESSSWSATVTFTTEAATVTQAKFTAGQ